MSTFAITMYNNTRQLTIDDIAPRKCTISLLAQISNYKKMTTIFKSPNYLKYYAINYIYSYNE